MRCFLWVLLATIGAMAAVARPAETGWASYKNAHYGLQMRYPTAVFSHHKASQAGDGDLFTLSLIHI